MYEVIVFRDQTAGSDFSEKGTNKVSPIILLATGDFSTLQPREEEPKQSSGTSEQRKQLGDLGGEGIRISG